MKIQDIPIIKHDQRGTIYRCESVNYIVRKKNTISANHNHKETETLYLIKGKIELTIGKETENVEAPKKFFVPASENHKVVALTDIKLIRDS